MGIRYKRLLGRTCRTCGGLGAVEVSQIIVSPPKTCEACLGTGLRLVERAEIARQHRGELNE
jgi:DnaJ-class molecular chaperone